MLQGRTSFARPTRSVAAEAARSGSRGRGRGWDRPPGPAAPAAPGGRWAAGRRVPRASRGRPVGAPARGPAQSRAPGRRASPARPAAGPRGWASRLALEVRDLTRLLVGALVGAGQLVLRLALALLLAALTAQRCVVGQVARGLLEPAGDLVGDAHCHPPLDRWVPCRATQAGCRRCVRAARLSTRRRPPPRILVVPARR